jgi:hypothetical protein
MHLDDESHVFPSASITYSSTIKAMAGWSLYAVGLHPYIHLPVHKKHPNPWISQSIANRKKECGCHPVTRSEKKECRYLLAKEDDLPAPVCIHHID